MNSAIGRAFDTSRGRGELALIPYLTAGFPTMVGFVEHLRVVADAGADLIEIGVPFCDPIADGPTIQYSSQVALASGARLPAIIEALANVRAKKQLAQPLIFMSYLNPLLAFGRERLLAAMHECGVNGLIPADLPVEESDEWCTAARANGINLIFLAAPTSPDARLREIAACCGGFVYAVSRTGTTGVQGQLDPSLPRFLERIRAQTQLPIAVGFGISGVEQVHALHGLADGVVIGSRIVQAIRDGEDVGEFVRGLRR